MVNSEKKAPYSWNQKSTLYSCDYLSGQFPDIDTRAIEKMVLENNMMIEMGVKNGCLRTLSEEEMTHYRKPFLREEGDF